MSGSSHLNPPQYPSHLVRYLAEGSKPRAIVSDILRLKDGHGNDGLLGEVFLLGALGRFAEDKSPLDLLSILVHCDAFGVYPPAEVLKHLADAAEAYLKNSGGAKSLDVLLGLRGKSKGADSHAKKVAESRKKDNALYAMLRLHWQGRISDAEAARKVAKQYGYKPKTLQDAFPAFRREVEKDRESAKLLKRWAQEDAGVRINRIAK
jgi:hypothetical protein